MKTQTQGKQSLITHFAIVSKDGFSNLALLCYHRWPVMSCKHEVLVSRHHIGWWYSLVNYNSQYPLHWLYNERDGVSRHQPHDYLLNCSLRRRSKKTSKLCVTGLCVVNSPVTAEFPAQKASNAENVSIWWRHHVNFPAPSIHDILCKK